MHVSELFENRNIRNGRDLANAFSSEEWLRIANYFMVRKYQWNDTQGLDEHPLGATRNQIRGLMVRINRDVGANQPSHSPAEWNLKAAKWGMAYGGDQNATWSDIYEHLAPHKDYELPPGWDVEGSLDNLGEPGQTEESGTEIANWVETDKDSWDNFQELKTEYLRPWFIRLFEERQREYPREIELDDGNIENEWKSWLSNNLSGTEMRRMADEGTSRFASIIAEEGSIPKETVDSILFQWLRSADNRWMTYLRTRRQ